MSTREMTTLEAMIDAIRIEMRRDPTVIYLGEGTGERGGTYGHTLGLYQEFGPERMIDTPISELGFTGACIGAAVNGCRPIADLMFMDFVADAMTQVINQAAKLRYMSNGQVGVPMVLWAGVGAVKSAGPHHSGCLYPWFMHVPGLKVVLPSNPADAKGLLAAAIRDDDPVIFCAHKLLFPRRGPVPEGEHLVPLGQAALLRAGRDATIVATGNMVNLALEAADRLAAEGIECDLLDLRSLVPLDADAVAASAAKTGRVLVVDEAYSPCGVGAEIAAIVNERVFHFLRAPVLRLHTASVSHPFSPVFDERIFPSVDQIVGKVRELVGGAAGSKVESAKARRLEPAYAAVPAAAAPQHPRTPAPAHPRTAESNGRLPVRIPNQGLTVEEARITRWLVAAGDTVREGQPLFEIETDKVLVEVESESDGIVDELVAKEDDVLPLGACVAWLRAR
jgi:2-oxoisovalerate dehydrogenase E1 component